MTLILVILDGWGHSNIKVNNAIAAANTPCWDKILQQYPHTLLSASGVAVGLPKGQMGNSEVGHATIGTGRILVQDLTRINAAIAQQTFFQNKVLKQAMHCALGKGALHLIGLLSDGGVHGHIDHLCATITMAKQQGVKKLYIHAILDGRDTAPKSAKQYIVQLEQHCNKVALGEIATIIGRYYAMDRDNNATRTAQAFDLLTKGQAEYNSNSAVEALEHCYENNITDEFIPALKINDSGIIKQDDTVIFSNFRSDRARQLAKMLAEVRLANLTTFAEYDVSLQANVVFPRQILKNTVGQIVAQNGLSQLRIAETEKYAHVTFFFNGGKETAYPNEERILVASPKVATYDLSPEMSALEVTAKVVANIASGAFDVIICNYANADMVGHTGKFNAAVKAVECLDHCLNEVINMLKKIDGEMLITADHGNVECMSNLDNNVPHTAHTTAKVPLLYIGRKATITTDNGTLADIAPTILNLLGLVVPKEMSGKNLLQLED